MDGLMYAVVLLQVQALSDVCLVEYGILSQDSV